MIAWRWFCLFLLFSASGVSLGAGRFSLQTTVGDNLEIRNFPLSVPNNTPDPYQFCLSVLGFEQDNQFVPLLGIAVRPLSDKSNEWLAVWNLSQEGAGVFQTLKSTLPFVWNPRQGREEISEDQNPSFPSPYLDRNSTRRIAWHRAGWTALTGIASFLDLYTPFQFALNNMKYYRGEINDRRFSQVYTLVRLYEEASVTRPSPLNLCPSAIVDLKYELLVNRKALGVLMEQESEYAVVQLHESSLRAKAGQVASYFHSEANLRHLLVEDVSYGTPGRPPVGRAGILLLRGVDLQEPLPEWTDRNPFDLNYNPFTHPRIRALMEQDPAAPIPLGFYVFNSELRLKPVLVVDFFEPGNPRSRQLTGTLKLFADSFLKVVDVPAFVQTAKFLTDFGLNRKDVTHFTTKSTISGIESAKLFARLGWNFDDDTNYLLLKSMENRIANPLSNSFRRESQNVHRNLAGLLNDDCAELKMYLRILFEDRIRAELDLGKRAIFAADVGAFERRRIEEDALARIRRFNDEANVLTLPWEKLNEAWSVVREIDPRSELPESREFLARLREIPVEAIPESQREMVREWLHPTNVQTAARELPHKTPHSLH